MWRSRHAALLLESCHIHGIDIIPAAHNIDHIQIIFVRLRMIMYYIQRAT